jgi:hypothetical protein
MGDVQRHFQNAQAWIWIPGLRQALLSQKRRIPE